MSLIVKGLHIAHAKLGRDIAKHAKVMESSTEKLEAGHEAYQAKLALAEEEYQKALRIAADARQLTLNDARESLSRIEKSAEATYSKAYHNHRTLSTLHKRLGAALHDHDRRGEALEGPKE